MIQEFSVRNFRSFKDEATLSFEATKDTTFEDTQVVTVAPQVRLPMVQTPVASRICC